MKDYSNEMSQNHEHLHCNKFLTYITKTGINRHASGILFNTRYILMLG